VESFAAGFQSRHHSVTVHIQCLESTICNLLSAAEALQPDSGGRDTMPSAARPGPRVNGSASPRSAEPRAMLIGGIACTLFRISAIVMSYGSAGCCYSADYYRLRQVLSNFLSNGKCLHFRYYVCFLTSKWFQRSSLHLMEARLTSV